MNWSIFNFAIPSVIVWLDWGSHHPINQWIDLLLPFILQRKIFLNMLPLYLWTFQRLKLEGEYWWNLREVFWSRLYANLIQLTNLERGTCSPFWILILVLMRHDLYITCALMVYIFGILWQYMLLTIYFSQLFYLSQSHTIKYYRNNLMRSCYIVSKGTHRGDLSK